MPEFTNAFFFVDSLGLPLTDVMRRCNERGFPVNLENFMQDARRAGWSKKKAQAVMEEALIELRGEHIHFVMRERG